jgi:hypothetical protein
MLTADRMRHLARGSDVDVCGVDKRKGQHETTGSPAILLLHVEWIPGCGADAVSRQMGIHQTSMESRLGSRG